MKIALILIVLFNTPLMGQNALVEKANKFLSSLPEPLRQKAQYKFDDEERFNWHFVPKARNGVSFRDFDPAQRDAALDLLRTSLSAKGYQKATAIMELENVLREVEGRGSNDKYRDPLNYYLTIFGSPADNKPWGWRFEGHHIALNFSSVSNRIESSTPSFFGSNPGIVRSGPEKGKQILKDESELAFSLVNSFDADKLKIALISETALPEIVSFNSRKAIPLNPAGLSYLAMNDQQRTLLTKLLETYVRNYELGFSNKLMEKIKKAGIDKLTFSWAGSLKPGSGYYYRIQGPMLLIELDNTQNDANHVHSVVRDLTNDFGEDILREHYEKEHSNH
ncbi:MAG TPA: DUF3500 domain-containing protein [Chryseolinea sp.]